MLRQTKVRGESFEVVEKVRSHGDHYTRNSVQRNTRNNVTAEHAAACYLSRMDDPVLNRLKEEVSLDGRSFRRISLDAGLGPNFVQQMMKTGKNPGAVKLGQVLDTLDLGAALYVITGVRLSRDEVETASNLSKLPDAIRSQIKGLIAAHIEQASKASD